MIYLSGTIRPTIKHPLLGFMNTPTRWGMVPDDVPWAADNGRFAAPERYSDDTYLEWLTQQPKEKCLFATAPDVVGDHEATVKLSDPMLPRLRDLGFRPAFVAQDGWSEETTPWDHFDVLFIGGTNAFKLGHGGEAIRSALRRGKRGHMGRVNSYRRLRLAALLGCSTADGTFLKYAPTENEGRMLRWLERLSRERFLPNLGASL